MMRASRWMVVNATSWWIPWACCSSWSSVQDANRAPVLEPRIRATFPRLQKLVADAGYKQQFIAWFARTTGWLVEMVQRAADKRGFQVLPKRWIVERTFAWCSPYRRLSKDYEY